MPLENYNADVLTDRNGQVLMFIIPLAGIAVLLILFLAAYFDYGTAPADQTVATHEAAQIRAQQLCSILPRPEKFDYFYGSTINEPPHSGTVVHHFRSVRPPEEIMPVFSLWFDANGWRRLPYTEATFQKGSQQIYISTFSNETTTYYEIYCSERTKVSR